jgi:O-antigen/teichoic acid export membrane protein
MLGAEQFGAFTLVYVTYGFTLNAVRGLSIEPLLVRFSGRGMRAWRRAASDSSGSAILVGLATGACVLVASIVIGGTIGQAFLGLGLILPFLMLQESWRFAFFAAGMGYHALINDVLWTVVEIPVLLVLKATGHVNVFAFVMAWGAGAAVSAVAGAFQARAAPSMSRALSWLRTHRDLGPRFLLENCGGNSADTLRSYTISSFLGLESVGYMQSANVLMGPFKILSFGIGMITIPEAAALMRRAPKKGLKYCVAVSAGQTAMGVLFTIALLIVLPLGLGQLALGSLWAPAYPLVLPTALTVISACASSGSSTGLHALGAAKRSLKVALTTAAISLSLAFAGALLGSMLITLYLVAAANWIGTMMSWLQLRVAMHERTVNPPSSRAAKNVREKPATAVAVSRPATQGSYVRETRQGMPQAARPGEEVS